MVVTPQEVVQQNNSHLPFPTVAFSFVASFLSEQRLLVFVHTCAQRFVASRSCAAESYLFILVHLPFRSCFQCCCIPSDSFLFCFQVMQRDPMNQTFDRVWAEPRDRSRSRERAPYRSANNTMNVGRRLGVAAGPASDPPPNDEPARASPPAAPPPATGVGPAPAASSASVSYVYRSVFQIINNGGNNYVNVVGTQAGHVFEQTNGETTNDLRI